jgi:uncharacterized protein involved in response to NO
MSVLLMLIALVGGRIIPSFTRNWLAKRGVTPLPAGFGAVDKVALVAGAVGLAGWVAAAEPSITGAALIVAGLAAALRLARWRGYRTAAEPLVWVLHAGHGWLALGLFLLGLSHLWAAVPSAAALHALTAGAIGTMILAVMTRATRGHTGRALAAGLGTTSIYLLVTAAAALRVAAAVATGLYLPLLIASGAAWVGAFLLFMALYGMPLLTPRLKTSEPGT